MKRLTILDTHEAQNITTVVNELKSHWIFRDNNALYTLGAAAYLDAPTEDTLKKFSLREVQPEQYQCRAEQNNDILWRNFEDLYFQIQTQLSEKLDREVVYSPRKALPGFHVFNAHDAYAIPNSHVPHYDRQYEQLDWGTDIKVGSAQSLSFTLPVTLPQAGGGLYLWDVFLDEVLSLNKSAALEYIKAAKIKLHSYTVGELVCHSGHQLHCIAPWRSNATDQRISMQGHGMLVNDIWQLYW